MTIQQWFEIHPPKKSERFAEMMEKIRKEQKNENV